MDRQTIEAAERVTAWSRARALSAVLALQANTPREAAEAEEAPLEEVNETAFHYTGEKAPDADRRQ